MEIFENIDLQALNTLAVPARARYFCQPTTIDELRQALQAAKACQCKTFILGGGSNVVLMDDIQAMVINPQIRGREILKSDENATWLTIGAAENWHETVLYTLQQDYFGLENLSLIPGSVGGAPIQNIGAYGVELCDVFDSLQAVHRISGELKHFNKEDCKFAYRDSIFKQQLYDQFVIVSVTLVLHKIPTLNLSYPALQQAVKTIPEHELTPSKVSELVCAIRQTKLPDPTDIPNAGSFFKNPIVSLEKYQRLRQQEPTLIAFDTEDQQKKIAAGWLIEQVGWRGKQIDGIGMHEGQALVLTNPGRRTGDHILRFAQTVQDSVWRRFGIQLDIEPSVFAN